jgi:hydroxymethylpyrimidine pyrophosphatase-like HAD family hydrolase
MQPNQQQPAPTTDLHHARVPAPLRSLQIQDRLVSAQLLPHSATGDVIPPSVSIPGAVGWSTRDVQYSMNASDLAAAILQAEPSFTTAIALRFRQELERERAHDSVKTETLKLLLELPDRELIKAAIEYWSSPSSSTNKVALRGLQLVDGVLHATLNNVPFPTYLASRRLESPDNSAIGAVTAVCSSLRTADDALLLQIRGGLRLNKTYPGTMGVIGGMFDSSVVTSARGSLLFAANELVRSEAVEELGLRLVAQPGSEILYSLDLAALHAELIVPMRTESGAADILKDSASLQTEESLLLFVGLRREEELQLLVSSGAMPTTHTLAAMSSICRDPATGRIEQEPMTWAAERLSENLKDHHYDPTRSRSEQGLPSVFTELRETAERLGIPVFVMRPGIKLAEPLARGVYLRPSLAATLLVFDIDGVLTNPLARDAEAIDSVSAQGIAGAIRAGATVTFATGRPISWVEERLLPTLSPLITGQRSLLQSPEPLTLLIAAENGAVLAKARLGPAGWSLEKEIDPRAFVPLTVGAAVQALLSQEGWEEYLCYDTAKECMATVYKNPSCDSERFSRWFLTHAAEVKGRMEAIVNQLPNSDLISVKQTAIAIDITMSCASKALAAERLAHALQGLPDTREISRVCIFGDSAGDHPLTEIATHWPEALATTFYFVPTVHPTQTPENNQDTEVIPGNSRATNLVLEALLGTSR